MNLDGQTDIRVVDTAAAKRTYGVPKAARETAARALSDHTILGSDDEVSAAHLLVSGAPLTLSEVEKVHLGSTEDVASHTLALHGGDAAQRWAAGIVRRAQIAQTVLAAAEVVKDELDETVQEAVIEDVDDFDDEPDGPQTYEDEIELYRQNPRAPHPYLPAVDAAIEAPCEVCGAAEPALIHMVEDSTAQDAEPLTAAIRGNDERLDDIAMRSYAVGDIADILTRRARAASAFYTDESSGSEHYLRPAEDGAMVASVLRRTDGAWKQWDPSECAWFDSDEPAASDITPIDDDSAYRSSLLFATSDGAPIPAADINPVEWAIAQDAVPHISASPDTDPTAQFCVAVDKDDVPVSLHATDGQGTFWAWDPRTAQFVPLEGVPLNCIQVDRDEAELIATDLVVGLVQTGRAPMSDGVLHVVDPYGNPVVSSAEIRDSLRYADRIADQITESFTDIDWLAEATRSAVIAGLLNAGEQYTTEERSKNAAKQFRDRMGRFSRVGDMMSDESGKSAQVMDYDETTGKATVKFANGNVQLIDVKRLKRLGAGPAGGKDAAQQAADAKRARRASRSRITKAVMKTMLPLLTPADIQQLLADYEADVAKRRKGLTASALTPDTSDVPPMYFAVVDELDREAVVDLIAISPASTTSTKPEAFIRTAQGWEADPKMMLRIKSTSPPPLVHLKPSEVPDILAQVDSYFKEKTLTAAAATTTASSDEPVELWASDGTLLPVSIRGGGVPGVADTPEDFAAVRRLRRYWLRGPGAAKIVWNTPGDYRRCVRHLRKYVGVRANGLCANYHKAATGMWTGDKRHRKMYGRRASAAQEAVYVNLGDGVLASVEQASVVDAQMLADQPLPKSLKPGTQVLVHDGEELNVLTVVSDTEVLGWDALPASLATDGDGRPTLVVREDS